MPRAHGLDNPVVRLICGSAIDLKISMPRMQGILHNRSMDIKPALRHAITFELDGKTYKGAYWLAGQILAVSADRGGKSRQIGTTEPEALATQLLLELVKAGKV